MTNPWLSVVILGAGTAILLGGLSLLFLISDNRKTCDHCGLKSSWREICDNCGTQL